MIMMRFVSVLLTVFLLGIGCGVAKGDDVNPRPNILFLISDDHSAKDLGASSKNGPRTPVLDRLAAAGARFTNAYTLSPQCSPSRSAMLIGRSPHATGTSRLHSTLTKEHDTVIDVLKRAGYYVGAFQKVHLGEDFQSRWQFYGGAEVPFEEFFKKIPGNKPFFLWVGFDDPHRPYKSGTISPPHDPISIKVPGFLPDTDSVRRDLADYYDEISRMDSDVGRVLSLLDSSGYIKNTIVVFASDNGMPFPGAKGSLYNDGVNIPLIVRWPEHIAAGQIRNEVVSLADLAPTWLEAAGAPSLPRMEGQSLMPVLTGKSSTTKDRAVFFERNWHDNLDLIRGVRSGQFLLIQN
ncbi:MAG TPA: sulfatase, partial [Acidobacteriota bacterium]|nr:sulfatase [Acidobacteriota bacterium]